MKPPTRMTQGVAGPAAQQQLGEVERPAAGEVVELGAAGEAVGEDDRVRPGTRTAGSRSCSATATETS